MSSQHKSPSFLAPWKGFVRRLRVADMYRFRVVRQDALESFARDGMIVGN